MNCIEVIFNFDMKNSKRICFIRHGNFPACPRLKKEASALAEAGFFLDVICLRKPGEKIFEKFGKIRVFRLPIDHKRFGLSRYFIEYLSSFFIFQTFLLLLFCINRYRVIQVNTMPDFLVFTTIIPKLLGSKIVLDLHEPTPELWVTKYGQKFSALYKLQRSIHRYAISYANHCISVTDTHSRYLQTCYSINPDKLTVIENVCDSSFEEYAKNYKPVKPSNQAFKLIMHGAIEKRYGHEVAIRALDLLKDTIPNLQVLIIGSGAYENDLKNLVDLLELNDSVKFLGFVPKDILLKNIMEADVGLVTMDKSPYSELIETNKMYEFMAMGKPVIISNLGLLVEKFGHENFQFFNPGDHHDFSRCIHELYFDKERRNEISRNAYNTYKKYEWKKIQSKYLKVIESLAKAGATKGEKPTFQ